jgi:hypothetical protein
MKKLRVAKMPVKKNHTGRAGAVVRIPAVATPTGSRLARSPKAMTSSSAIPELTQGGRYGVSKK